MALALLMLLQHSMLWKCSILMLNTVYRKHLLFISDHISYILFHTSFFEKLLFFRKLWEMNASWQAIKSTTWQHGVKGSGLESQVQFSIFLKMLLFTEYSIHRYPVSDFDVYDRTCSRLQHVAIISNVLLFCLSSQFKLVLNHHYIVPRELTCSIHW